MPFSKLSSKGSGCADNCDEEAKRKLLEEKAQRRAALREEFQKLKSDPFRHALGEDGLVFDPAIQRYHALQVNYTEYFKPSLKNVFMGITFLILPMTVYGYIMYTVRDKKERAYRSGQVAYKDRTHKFK